MLSSAIRVTPSIRGNATTVRTPASRFATCETSCARTASTSRSPRTSVSPRVTATVARAGLIPSVKAFGVSVSTIASRGTGRSASSASRSSGRSSPGTEPGSGKVARALRRTRLSVPRRCVSAATTVIPPITAVYASHPGCHQRSAITPTAIAA